MEIARRIKFTTMTKMRNNAIFLAQVYFLTQRPARFAGKLWFVINNNPGYLLALTGSFCVD
nr:hypothetical protein [Shigella dysenteriae]